MEKAQAPGSGGEDPKYAQAQAKEKEMEARIGEYGADDKEVWKFATESLASNKPELTNMGFLLIVVAVAEDPNLLERGLALAKTSSRRPGRNTKTASLELALQLMKRKSTSPFFKSVSASHSVGESLEQGAYRESEIERRGGLSEDDKRLILKELRNRDSLDMLQALTLLMLATDLRAEDSKWARTAIKQKAAAASGDERSFWMFVLDSMQ